MEDKATYPLLWICGKPAIISGRLFTALIMTCLGSSLPFGYGLGVLNNINEPVKCFLKPAYCFQNQSSNSTSTYQDTTALFSFLTSMYILLGIFGSVLSAPLSDHFGRRNSLLLTNCITMAGGILALLPLVSRGPWSIYVSRALFGINAGMSSVLAPNFLAEIAPISVRGALTSCHQLVITAGIMLAYFMTMDFCLNTTELWPIAIAFPALPALCSFIVLPFMHESPRYLFLNSNRVSAARAAFAAYNRPTQVENLLHEVEIEGDLQRTRSKFNYSSLFLDSSYRKPLSISISLCVIQQTCGINPLIMYSKTTLSNIGFSEKAQQWGVFLLGFTIFSFTLFSVFLVDRFGRRTLLKYPAIFCLTSIFGIFVVTGIIPRLFGPESTSWTSMFALVLMGCFVSSFAGSLGALPSVIISELFTQAPRTVAYSVSLSIMRISSFMIVMLFPILNEFLPTGFAFLCFVLLSLPLLIYLLVVMPETRMKTFAEITLGMIKENSKEVEVT